MANKKKDDTTSNRSKSNDMLDAAAKKILSVIDPSYRDRKIIGGKDYAVQQIINRELDLAKGVSDNNIVDFIATMDTRSNGMLYKNRINDKEIPLNYDNIFTENVQDIFQYFQEANRNKYLQMQDLKLISRFIPSIGKGVSVMLSSICNSDDVSDNMIRNIVFPTGTSESDKKLIMATIESCEKSLRLKKKIRSTFKKTLVAGEYYVYAVNYNEVFDEYRKLDQAGYFQRMNIGFNPAQNTKILNAKGDRGFVLNNRSTAKEAMMVNGEYIDTDISISMDSYMSIFENKGWSKEDRNFISKSIENMNFSCHIQSSRILWDAVLEASASSTYDKTFNKDSSTSNLLKTSDATATMGDATGDKKYQSKMNQSGKFDVSGLYIKFIDAKNVLPIKIFDQLVGYFYVRTKPTGTKKNAYQTRTANTSIFNGNNMSETKKDAAINAIADVISTGIMANFSPEFVNSNAGFKEIIAECLISNGFANNDFNIQFIPATDMIRYIVNEDENGNGESMLADSLFPARLLLEYITSKLLTYFNKGGNKQIAHVHKGPIDANADNQIQRVLRMLQESNITFNDLLSSSMVFSKFTRDSNMQLPTSRNGDKIVEFEQIDGQDVDMHTPMEEFLEKMAIQGMHIPDTFMDRISDTGFSRQIISDHIELAEIVSGYQSELEEPTTMLYRKLVEASNLPDNLKSIGRSLEYKLPRPKALQNANGGEFVSSEQNYAENLANILYGPDTSNEAENKKRAKFISRATKESLPFIDWAKYEQMMDDAAIDAAAEVQITKKEVQEDPGLADDNEW